MHVKVEQLINDDDNKEETWYECGTWPVLNKVEDLSIMISSFCAEVNADTIVITTLLLKLRRLRIEAVVDAKVKTYRMILC